MFRSYQGKIDSAGMGTVDIRHNNTAMEWDIYQVSCSCGTMGATCVVILYVNGAFLCASPQGSLDTATGPPDIVINSSDLLTAEWQLGTVGDEVTVNIWYNENPVGTTYSMAH
jgi:hypothetical protein